MIHIIGNTTIPVNPGTSLSLVLRSFLFDDSDGKTPGSFIFNHKLPATPELRKEFGYGHRSTLSGRATSERPYIIQQGTLRFTGTCQLQEANDFEYEVLYNVRNGDFAYEAASISLKDLDLGGDRPLSLTAHAIAMNTAGIEHQDWRYNSSGSGGGFTDEFNLVFTGLVVDFTNSFSIAQSSFTADQSGNYIFKSIINFIPTYGSVSLRIYKNNVLLSDNLLAEGLNIFDYTWALTAGDVLQFRLFGTSGQDYTYQDNTPYNDVLYFTIDTGLIFEIRKAESLFVDCASGSQDTFDYALFPVLNPDFFDNFPADEFQIDNVNIGKVYSESFFVQNYFKDGYFPFVLSGLQDGKIVYAMNVFTPFAYMKYLLGAIAAKLDYELVSSPFDTAEFYNAVLFNTFAENTYSVDDASMIGVKPTFNLVDHVPDVKVNTFLNSLGKMIGYRIDINTELRTITFVNLKTAINTITSVDFPGIITERPTVLKPEYLGYKLSLKASTDKFIEERIKAVNSKHVYKGSVTHINQLPTAGNKVNDMYLVTALNEFYVWKYSTEFYKLAWCYHSQNFYLNRQSGVEPFLEIASNMAPVIDNAIADETLCAPANRRWRIPITWQAGNFEGYPDMSEEFGMQLLIYKGLQPDSNNQNYPLAISGRVDYAGTEFASNLCLCLDGPTPNLFTSQLQPWIEWLVNDAKRAKFKAVLTPAQLYGFDFSKKYRILGNNYLIKEIRVNLIDDHLSESDIDGYTC